MDTTGGGRPGPARGGAQRRSPRLPIEVKAVLSGRSPRDVTVVDLSLGGCLVRCDALLDHGAILDLRLPLGDEPMAVKVRVAESFVDGDARGAGKPGFLAGLEFLGPPGGDLARLRRFLDAERRRRNARSPAP
jgi:hypothetical protein